MLIPLVYDRQDADPALMITTAIALASVSVFKKASNEEARKVLACGGARPNEPSGGKN